jgi:hypothetical protein
MDTQSQNDHDILIEVRTTLHNLLQTQKDYIMLHRQLAERVAALEVKDSGNAEKLTAIAGNVVTLVANQEKVNRLEGEISTLAEAVEEMKRKTYLLDMLNAIGVTIAAALAYAFGRK